MTFKKLKELMETHNILEDVEMLSDSGWECDATDMNVIWYNKKDNQLIFTQEMFPQDYDKYHNYKCIYDTLNRFN